MPPSRSLLRAAVREHETRIRTLEREAAIALDPDGNVLLVKAGDGDTVRFADHEAERIRGAAVLTHNHPHDRSFSERDVATACGLEIGELRAVGPTWTHVLRPGIAGWTIELWTECLEPTFLACLLTVHEALRRDVVKGRLGREEAEAEFHHLVMERVAEAAGLDYERYLGDRSDAD